MPTDSFFLLNSGEDLILIKSLPYVSIRLPSMDRESVT